MARCVQALLVIAVLCSTLFAQPKKQTVQEKLGYPATARLLIIHADDLGMSRSVNRATFEALEKGWVTSASILVPCPWFPEVATWAKAHPDADLGIHLALNSEWTGFRWGPVSPVDKVPSLLDEQGYFPLLETQVAPKAKLPEVEMELRAQIERARKTGIRLSHFDTHMTALTLSPGLFQTYKKLGREYGLPILLERTPGTYLPQGQTVSDDALIDKVVSIPPGVALQDWLKAYKEMLQPLGPGVYELVVHTAYDDDEMRGATWDHPNWGAAWRQFDLDTLRSPEFQQFIKDQGFILIRWRDLAKALPANYATAGK